MERTKYRLSIDSITLEDLQSTEEYLSKEEIREMNRKIRDIMGSFFVDDVQTRALMEKMLKQGYIAAHAYYPEY